jgi:hypothetical protein
MGATTAVNTSSQRYGRCSDCAEIKHLTAEGVMLAHNHYRAEGTSLAVTRCPGSGRRPDGPEPGGITP